MTEGNWVRRIYDYYTERGLIWPTTHQAMMWLVSEVGEVSELLTLIGGAPWVRNNPEAVPIYSDRRLGEELGDVIFMAIVVGMTRGVDPLELLEAKMARKLKEVKE